MLLTVSPVWPQSGSVDCRASDPTTVNVPFHLRFLPNSCFLASGGYSQDAGSFAAISAVAGNYLGLDETITLGAQYGLRSRTVQVGFAKALVPDNTVQAGFAFYGQRFRYDQGQEGSLLAYSRDVTETQFLAPDDWLKYVSHRYGGESFVQKVIPGSFSSFRLSYSYDVTGIRPLTPSTSDYFGAVHFLGTNGANRLTGIHTSKVTASFLRDTVDHPIGPARGAMFSGSLGVAGLGGDVRMVEPAVEAKWFHPGLWRRHVIAIHARASVLSGFGGQGPPPFDRDYMGGEQEIRGFSSWALSPIAYVPGISTIPVLYSDGQRTSATMNIPVYRPVAIGGDTKALANLEYRIPLGGPFTLALFTDAGMNRAWFSNQLRFSSGVIDSLNAAFPYAQFSKRPQLQPDAQPIKMSTGLELQVLAPKIHAPVRFYWAYNVVACTDEIAMSGTKACNLLTSPVVAGTQFPNYATYQSAQLLSAPQIFRDPRSMLRIAIGFSF